MVEYAKKLFEDFVFVRVDLYNIDGLIYLGEMTFTPSNMNFMMKNKQQSIEIGKLIDVNKIKKNYLIESLIHFYYNLCYFIYTYFSNNHINIFDYLIIN